MHKVLKAAVGLLRQHTGGQLKAGEVPAQESQCQCES